MLLSYVIFFACVLTCCCNNIPSENNTAIISTYAKVARWGVVSPTEKTQSEGRSHTGQALWSHSSDAKIIGGQNLKTQKPKIVYHYAEKLGQGQKQASLGVGEVQERFNPRPYFDYIRVPPKSSQGEAKPSKVDVTDSFPVFSQPPTASNLNLYSSQYNSYNPPSAGSVSPVDDSKLDVAYPPNAPPPPEDIDSSKGYAYNPPNDAPTLGPPLSPNHYDSQDQAYYSPPSEEDDHKGQIYYPPPENPDHHDQHLYYPPSGDGGHHETILDHPPPGWQESNSDQKMNGHSGMKGNGMKGNGMNENGMKGNGMNGNGHDMAEHDLSPPPSPDFHGQFPLYLYNGPSDQGHDFEYDFDSHHVYKEVTTTEAPEDERVNKGQYSYYYLGRKLWYIPLYFSLYFILYVTVLILKSIARHKVQLKQDYLTREKGKDMHHGRSLNLDELHQNVTTAINTNRKKIAYIAM